MIRTMNKNDIDSVIEILKSAFDGYFIKANKKEKSSKRSKLNIEMLMAECKDGALVLEVENKVVGVIFTHLLGDFGWIGPLAINPSIQGMDYGKTLLERGIDFLKKSNCKNISLGTMVDAPWNVSLYMKSGFKLEPVMINLTKNLKYIDNNNNYESKVSIQEYEPQSNYIFIKDDFLISYENLLDSLRLSKTRKAFEFIKNDEVIGFGIMEFKDKYNNETTLLVKSLYSFNSEDIVDILLSLEKYAKDNCFIELSIALSSTFHNTILSLYNLGYKSQNLIQIMSLIERSEPIKGNLLGALLG